MQEIANRLISNTPELAKMLDSDSALRPRKPGSPSNKKAKAGNTLSSIGGTSVGKVEMTANDYHDKCKDLSSEVQHWKEKSTAL